MRSDDGERAKNYSHRFFFFTRVPCGLDAHDLSHSTPYERLEQAKYDRPRERSPEWDCS